MTVDGREVNGNTIPLGNQPPLTAGKLLHEVEVVLG